MSGSIASRNYPYAVILAGGQGTRFWPLSRRHRPKQFLTVLGRTSLLQQTVSRLKGLVPQERILVVTYEEMIGPARKQLPQLEASQFLAEPAQRNTAAAVGMAAHELSRKNPEAIMVVLPADHLIRRKAKFHQAIRLACRVAAREGNSVLLGIPPLQPETGFGYLKLAPHPEAGYGKRVRAVEQFTEKPDLRKAKRFLASGCHVWNAGIFIWRASTYLKNLQRFLPATAKAFSQGGPGWGTPEARPWLARIYPKLRNISVDYGVMEKAANVFAVEADIGWSDVGSWEAVYSIQKKAGSLLPTASLSLDSRGNYVSSDGKVVALIGVDNLIVVDTQDALLICRRDRAQDVGKIVRKLKQQRQSGLL